MIKTKIFKLSQSSTLTPNILKEYIQLFWDDVFSKLFSSKNMHLMIICKVRFTDTNLGYRTLADMRKVNISDSDLFKEYLVERLGILSDSYNVNPVAEIIFTYIVRDGIAEGNRALLQSPVYEVTTHKFNNFQLPLSMNPNDYGTLLSTEEQSDYTRYIVSNKIHVFVIDAYFDTNTNNVRIEGVIDLAWTDTKISDKTFKRDIGKNTLFIENGEVIVKSKELTAKPFTRIKKDERMMIDNYMTIDIETITIDNKMVPYLICGYTGKKLINSYATGNSEAAQAEMFVNFFKQILEFKNIRYVYAHNLSGFDGIFILKHLIKFNAPGIEPILFNGKLMAIKLKIGSGKNARTIVFKDSYLILPLSLRNLCRSFGVSSVKGHFPFNLSDITYVGEFPSFDMWKDITAIEYEQLKLSFSSKFKNNKLWSFKDEAIEYCFIDCKALFEVLEKFNELIFFEFKLNIHKSLTLPSLAMKIYKAYYLKPNTIYQILGNIEKDIREAYTGGAVDVYLPHNGVHQDYFSDERQKLYYYDANSLYPFVMGTLEMPVGKPIAFEGNIRNVEPEAYGFFYCKITSPKYIEHPILQRRIKTADGVRTIAGLGTWEGWIFSMEMDNAERFGYQFEIIRGYKFKSDIIFKEYVNKMYALRQKYPKNDPMNLIAKLLLNSLYGKFGMKPETTIVEIFDSKNVEQMNVLHTNLETFGEFLQDYIILDEYHLTIRNSKSNAVLDENDLYHGVDVNIPIASAVTAGGRMWMSQLKNRPDIKLYYSDTDSVIIGSQLVNDLIGSELGKFKLEYEIDRAVFIAPKVYAFKTSDGQEVIKIKGLKDESVKDLHVSDLERLLIKDFKVKFTQDKWFKGLIDGQITIAQMAYELKVTSNKREAIYHTYEDVILDNKFQTVPLFNKTRPYYYDDIILSDARVTHNKPKIYFKL